MTRIDTRIHLFIIYNVNHNQVFFFFNFSNFVYEPLKTRNLNRLFEQKVSHRSIENNMIGKT